VPPRYSAYPLSISPKPGFTQDSVSSIGEGAPWARLFC
jgi:hypothetical protein